MQPTIPPILRASTRNKVLRTFFCWQIFFWYRENITYSRFIFTMVLCNLRNRSILHCKNALYLLIVFTVVWCILRKNNRFSRVKTIRNKVWFYSVKTIEHKAQISIQNAKPLQIRLSLTFWESGAWGGGIL